MIAHALHGSSVYSNCGKVGLQLYGWLYGSSDISANRSTGLFHLVAGLMQTIGVYIAIHTIYNYTMHISACVMQQQ